MLALTYLFALHTEVCQPGWDYFNGYCYFTSSNCTSWPTAERKCAKMGSHLATVHDQEENVYIQHRHNGEKSWIGLNDRSVEGSFVWTKKGTSSFRFWGPNQPIIWIRTAYTLLAQRMNTLGMTFHAITASNLPVLKVNNLTYLNRKALS